MFAQQNFPVQYSGEYICQPRFACTAFKVTIRADTSSLNKFHMTDSCYPVGLGDFISRMSLNTSINTDSFYVISSTLPVFCYLAGNFINNDSISALGFRGGCGSPGCSCMEVYSCKKVGSTRLNENKTQVVQLYPNPVKDALQLKGIKEPLSFRLSNIQGQLLKSGMVSSQQPVRMSELPQGIYLLQLGEGREQIWKKVVKE